MVDVPTTNRQAISTTRICLIMIDYCTSSCLIIILWIPLTLLIAVHFGKPPRKYHTPRKSWDKSPNPQIDLIWILYQIILPGYPMMPASLPWSFLSRFTWLSLASWRFQPIWKYAKVKLNHFPMDRDENKKCLKPRNLQQDPRFTDPKQPEYLIALSPDLGVRWDSVPFNFWWFETTTQLGSPNTYWAQLQDHEAIRPLVPIRMDCRMGYPPVGYGYLYVYVYLYIYDYIFFIYMDLIPQDKCSFRYISFTHPPP